MLSQKNLDACAEEIKEKLSERDNYEIFNRLEKDLAETYLKQLRQEFKDYYFDIAQGYGGYIIFAHNI